VVEGGAVKLTTGLLSLVAVARPGWGQAYRLIYGDKPFFSLRQKPRRHARKPKRLDAWL
jgi:hypothetical protein